MQFPANQSLMVYAGSHPAYISVPKTFRTPVVSILLNMLPPFGTRINKDVILVLVTSFFLLLFIVFQRILPSEQGPHVTLCCKRIL